MSRTLPIVKLNKGTIPLKRKKTQPSKPTKPDFSKHKPAIFWTILTLFTVVTVFTPLSDVDIWWHIAMGKGVMTHFSLPPAADFYWSPIAYEIPRDLRFTWFGDLWMAIVFSLGGSVGLQLMAFVAVAFCLWCLWDISGRVTSGRVLLVLILFVAGTYQMQIVRNALFGLPGTVATLWLWWRIHQGGKAWLWWIYPPLLGIWSCMHGTYLFGFGILLFLIIGEAVDRLRSDKALSWHYILLRAGVLTLSYILIAVYNAFTWNVTQTTLDLVSRNLVLVVVAGLFAIGGLLFLVYKTSYGPKAIGNILAAGAAAAGLLLVVRHFLPYFTDDVRLKTLDLRAYKAQVDVEALGLFGRIKHGLNNTFWKSDVQQMASLDFFPPFDFAKDLYVWSSLILLILALVAVMVYKRWRLVHLLPLSAVVFLGLGYVRTVGFLAIFGAYLLVMPTTLKPKRWVDKAAWVASGSIALLAIISVISHANPIGYFADHQFRLGHATYFPQALAKKVAESYPDTPTFTTIENGGYILNEWYPDKKVFMDGFFRPHEGKTFLDYSHVLEARDPDFLFENYGLTHAIVGVRDSAWFEIFNSAPAWVPRMADRGAILFERVPEPPMDYSFDLLINQAEWSALPDYLKVVVAMRLYDIGFKFLSEGLMEQAIDLLGDQTPISNAIAAAAPAQIRNTFQKSIAHLEGIYGSVNDPLIRIEFELSEAIQNGDLRTIIRTGEILISHRPQREQIWRVLIDTAEKLGQTELAEAYRMRRAEARGQSLPD